MARRRNQPEAAIQKAVVQHLKARAVPNLCWFSIPNGGWRSPVEAKIFQSLGVTPGMPDMEFIHAGKAYFLELKAEDGRPTENQLVMRDRLNSAGAFVAITYGLDAAIKTLEAWQLLRGRAA